MGKSQEKVKSERTVFPYVLLREASKQALVRAQESEDPFIDCSSAILFSAFCIEAFLNHLGDSYVPYWKSIERVIQPKPKLEIISHHLNFPLDFGKRPFQNFPEIIKYRNWLVHGRNETLTSDWEVSDIRDELLEEDLTKWEEMTTLINAERYFEDIGIMIKELNNAAGLAGDPFYAQRTVSYSYHPPKEEDQ